jgi:hypothetical protein
MQTKTFLFFCLFNFIIKKNIHKKYTNTHITFLLYFTHTRTTDYKILNIQINLNNMLNDLNLQKEAPK